MSSVGVAPPGGELPIDLIARGKLFVETRDAFSPTPVGCYELANIDPKAGTDLGAMLLGLRPRSDVRSADHDLQGHGRRHGGYGGSRPRLPRGQTPGCGPSYFSLGACFATGRTIDEAKAGLPDALALHIEGMKAGGLPLPSPRSRVAVLATVDEPVVADYVVEIEPELPAARPPSVSVKPTQKT